METKFINQDDLKQFDELYIEGEPDLFLQLVDSYSTTSAEKIEELKKFSSQENWSSVGKSAHALKSSSLTLGARKLGNLCEEVEEASKDITKHSQLPKLLEDLFEVYIQSLRELIILREQKNKRYI